MPRIGSLRRMEKVAADYPHLPVSTRIKIAVARMNLLSDGAKKTMRDALWLRLMESPK